MKASASALTAQRIRMDVISNNVANAETTRTEAGGPYKREQVVFNAKSPSAFGAALESVAGGDHTSSGVEVVSVNDDEAPPRLVYDPKHPDANQDGYVAYPNINPVNEMIDMMSANRAYQANVTILNAAKSMALKALDIGRS
jgi:flagellar basal-body rod protein FlgC